jgi:periplasmic copper chaperone A
MRTTGAVRSLAITAAAVLVGGLGLTACGEGTQTAAPAADQAASVTMSDAWVKAVDGGMTAAFGVLSNTGEADATLVAASTPAAAKVEIHEVVMGEDGDMVMQPKEGGVVVAAGGSATLEPGGDHIMLMDVTGPIMPGDEVTLTLEFSDGSTLDVTATAKEFSGGNEEYMPGQG